MKVLYKSLKYLAVLILALFLAGVGYIYSSGPTITDDTKEIIKQVLRSPLPELIPGETGYAISDNLHIWYEVNTPKDSSKGTILLIMGIANDALGWPLDFIRSLVDSGYSVIRYDHRGTGMSDWCEDRKEENAYSLTDMAMDGIRILDTLGIERAHIVGGSMGGMIAQQLAINHKDRVASLTSMFSSGDILDKELPPFLKI